MRKVVAVETANMVDFTTPPARLPTRERILLAGVHLFQVNGYHATGVAQILKLAEAPKGSFYHHFPDGKEALAIAALTRLEGEVSKLLDGLSQGGNGPEHMVRGMVRYIVTGLRNLERMRGFLFAILAQEAAHDSPAIQTALTSYVDAIRRRLIDAHAVDAAAGEARLFADQALALLQGGAVLARVDGRPEIVEEIVHAWLDAGRPQAKEHSCN